MWWDGSELERQHELMPELRCLTIGVEMDRLGALDESFLDLENSGPPIAVGSVVGVQGKAPTIGKLRAFFESRLDSMPRFSQSFQSSRSKVMRGKWVETIPDLTHHIRQHKLRPGGNIDEVVSEVMETKLDWDRPLWDVTLVSGYSAEQWTLIIRLHHAVADGQGALILLGQLIDLDPTGHVRLADGITAMAASREFHGDPADEEHWEGAAGKAVKALEKSFRISGQFISTLPDTVRSALMFMPRKQLDTLTGEVSGKRLWVSGRYSLDEVKAAKRSLKGFTINDIVMAAVAVGFTDLLESRGEDPEGKTLRTVIPLSLRRNLESNNQVGLLPVPLPLGDIEPRERLRAISKATKHSKNSTLPILGDQMVKMVEKVTPAPAQEAVLSKFAQNTDYFSETLVTNVPGPQMPIYFMGSYIVSSAPIIPIEAHFRIIVGITSFHKDLNIGITGDGEYAQDIDVLRAGIERGFAQVVEYAEEKKNTSQQKKTLAAVKAAQDRVAKSK